MVGTWELDVAASTFVPGPPLKSEIRLYEPEHEGIKATVATTYADGRRTVFEYITSYNDVTAARGRKLATPSECDRSTPSPPRRNSRSPDASSAKLAVWSPLTA